LQAGKKKGGKRGGGKGTKGKKLQGGLWIRKGIHIGAKRELKKKRLVSQQKNLPKEGGKASGSTKGNGSRPLKKPPTKSPVEGEF